MSRLKISKGANKILPVFKPVGFSTFDLIRKFKKETGFSGKIGHAGTLDPFACGVVLLLLGPATRKFEEIKKWQKVYLGGLRLGLVSSTGDPEGDFKGALFYGTKKDEGVWQPNKGEITNALKDFVGEISQKVPLFSAAKYKGVPFYKLAKRGKAVQRFRKVKIEKVELLYYRYPLLTLRVFCQGGTYIRQLAEDIGEKLKCGAFLYYLQREAIGRFNVKDSLAIDDFKKYRGTLK